MFGIYDTASGIRSYLRDGLEGLNRLASDRSADYRKTERRLNEFCILGRWYLDTCGNCGLMVDRIPAELYRVNKYDENSRMPEVLTGDELGIFMRGESYGWTSGPPFPTHYSKCSLCEESWALENAHDFHHTIRHDEFPLEDFVGKPLAEVRTAPHLQGVHQHYVNRETVRNPAKPPDEGRKSPWHYVDKDYIVKSGDVVSIQISVYTHTDCYRRKVAKEQRVVMKEAFAKAGYPDVSLITIPNEYWPGNIKNEAWVPPWYMAQVGDGPVLKVGWRKRVMVIDWSAAGKKLQHLFESENVTKEEHLIHAYTYEKAAEYLAKVLPEIQ